MGLFSSSQKTTSERIPDAPDHQLPEAAETSAATRSLQDQFAVRELIGRFACCIDFCDWEAFENLFTATVSVKMDPRTAPSPPAPVPSAAWARVAEASFAPYDSTHHIVTVDYVTFTDEGAEVVSHFQASHYLTNQDGGPTFVQKGTYLHHCRRTAEGWRISGWEQDVRWGTGNRAVMDKAMEEMPKDLF